MGFTSNINNPSGSFDDFLNGDLDSRSFVTFCRTSCGKGDDVGYFGNKGDVDFTCWEDKHDDFNLLQTALFEDDDSVDKWKASRGEQVEIDKEDDDDDIVVAANEMIYLVRVQTPRIAMVIMFLVMIATEMVKCQPLSNSFVTLINPFWEQCYTHSCGDTPLKSILLDSF